MQFEMKKKTTFYVKGRERWKWKILHVKFVILAYLSGVEHVTDTMFSEELDNYSWYGCIFS